MEVIGTAASVISVLQLAITVAQFLLGPGFSYRSGRYGRIGTALHYLGLVDTDAVRKCHLNINRWKDDDVLAWKTSYVSSCSAIAVAVRFYCVLRATLSLMLIGCYLCDSRPHRTFITQHVPNALDGKSALSVEYGSRHLVGSLCFVPTAGHRDVEQSLGNSFVVEPRHGRLEAAKV